MQDSSKDVIIQLFGGAFQGIFQLLGAPFGDGWLKARFPFEADAEYLVSRRAIVVSDPRFLSELSLPGSERS